MLPVVRGAAVSASGWCSSRGPGSGPCSSKWWPRAALPNSSAPALSNACARPWKVPLAAFVLREQRLLIWATADPFQRHLPLPIRPAPVEHTGQGSPPPFTSRHQGAASSVLPRSLQPCRANPWSEMRNPVIPPRASSLAEHLN